MLEWAKDIFNPLIKELFWSISSPQILNFDGSDYSTLAQEWWLEKIDQNRKFYLDLNQNPLPLESEFRALEYVPLGKRHEFFIRFFLANTPSIELLSHSFQIIEQNKTLGEIDFIFIDLTSGITYQLEVACKFYLQHKRSKSWKNFVGPNANDNLFNKIEKTKRQLTLTGHQQFKNHFPNISPIDIRPVASLRGYIFHHYLQLSQALPPSASCNNYNAGWYCNESEMPHFFGNKNHWSIIRKRNWLSPFQLELDDPSIMSSTEIVTICKNLLKQSKQSIALVQLQATHDGFQELSRGFVVHNNWPNIK